MYPKGKKGRLEAKGAVIPFLIYSVKITSLADPRCVSLSGPSWSWVSRLSCQPVCSRWNQLCFCSSAPSLTRKREWRGILWCLCRYGFSLLCAWPPRCIQVASASRGSQWGWDWSSRSWPTNWSLSVCPTKHRRQVINCGTLIAFKTKGVTGRFASWVSHLLNLGRTLKVFTSLEDFCLWVYF